LILADIDCNSIVCIRRGGRIDYSDPNELPHTAVWSQLWLLNGFQY